MTAHTAVVVALLVVAFQAASGLRLPRAPERVQVPGFAAPSYEEWTKQRIVPDSNTLLETGVQLASRGQRGNARKGQEGGFFPSLPSLPSLSSVPGASAVGGAAGAAAGAAAAITGAMLSSLLFGPAGMTSSADIEDCTACQYIWYQISQDIGGQKSEETIYNTFVKNCKDAGKTAVFGSACSDMMEYISIFIFDYQLEYGIPEMCDHTRLCRA